VIAAAGPGNDLIGVLQGQAAVRRRNGRIVVIVAIPGATPDRPDAHN
jgi:hypothetical protein